MNTKLLIITVLMFAFIMPGMAQKKKKNSKKDKNVAVIDTIVLKAKVDSISYGLGVLMGTQLKRSGFDSISTAKLILGMDEAMSGKKTLITPEIANAILNQYAQEMNNAKGKKNMDAGKAFLEKNKADSGVVVLQSGLQYKILKAGTGNKPLPTDKVKVHYHGTLIDGTVFDSSVKRGEPIELNVNGVIQGWQEALQLMPEGSKWKLFIPASLGYGEKGAGGTIGPNSTLIFEVELISIVKE
jgi:FKBP-type peptidyl-prolyl cis-trans isomerase FklB